MALDYWRVVAVTASDQRSVGMSSSVGESRRRILLLAVTEETRTGGVCAVRRLLPAMRITRPKRVGSFLFFCYRICREEEAEVEEEDRPPEREREIVHVCQAQLVATMNVGVYASRLREC